MYKTFDIAPFFSKLIVGVGPEPSIVTAQINLAFPGIGIDWGKEHAGYGAVTYEVFHRFKGKKNKQHCLVVILDESESSGDGIIEATHASHEAVHVVNWVFKNSGVIADPDNDELQAYLTGWVVQAILETINEYRKSIKTKTKK